MRRSCFMVCPECGEFFEYLSGMTKKCSLCGAEIVIEKGIELLVMELNETGLTTQASCEGHIDENRWNFPWISLLNDNKDWDRVKDILLRYNNSFGKGSEWEFTIHPNHSIKRWWIVPTHKERSLENLHKEANVLADFISKQASFHSSLRVSISKT